MNLIQVVDSSNVAAFGYDPETKHLQVNFKHGGNYRYKEVPSEVFEDFKLAESKGKFMHARVIKSFEFEKIDAPVER